MRSKINGFKWCIFEKMVLKQFKEHNQKRFEIMSVGGEFV